MFYRFLPPLGCIGLVAGEVKLADDGAVHHPGDGLCSGVGTEQTPGNEGFLATCSGLFSPSQDILAFTTRPRVLVPQGSPDRRG